MNPLEKLIGGALRSHGWSLSVAESCTGGLLASRITDIPGASDYFLGGVVAYENVVKERLLGVSAETLSRYGAVSEKTALEMAQGCQRIFGSDLSVAITGIAGPGGGTPEKPVGTVFVAVATSKGLRSVRLQLSGERIQNKAQSVDAALKLCLEAMRGDATG